MLGYVNRRPCHLRRDPPTPSRIIVLIPDSRRRRGRDTIDGSMPGAYRRTNQPFLEQVALLVAPQPRRTIQPPRR